MKQLNRVRFRIFTAVLLRSHGFLGCDTVLLAYCFLMFQRNVVSLSSTVEVSMLLGLLNPSALRHYLPAKCWGATYCTTQCHLPQDLIPHMTEPGEDVPL